VKQGRVFPRLLVGLVVSLSLALPALGLETFSDEAKAQQHCPKDIVVWLNLPTMIWHYKGQRWYARTLRARRKPAQRGRGGRGMGSEYGESKPSGITWRNLNWHSLYLSRRGWQHLHRLARLFIAAQKMVRRF
jgi:hypothetical protein